MLKGKVKGSESCITFYTFKFMRKKWVVALSETKWHDGENYKRIPIWFSNIKGEIPSLFIGRLAIGFEQKKNS